MIDKILEQINEIEARESKDHESNRQHGCNSFACGSNIGYINCCHEIKYLIKELNG